MREIFAEKLGDIEDYRCQCDVEHPLLDILILIICSVLCGVDEINKMVEYGKSKKRLLRKRFGIKKIPSASTICRVLATLKAEVIIEKTIAIMREILGESGEIIAVDGKEVCSFNSRTRSKLRIVTAYMVENGLILGQLAVDEKTNEIPCFQELLDLIDIEGKIITSDAMGAQKETVSKIIEKGGSYCMCLKGNQRSFHENIELYFNDILNSKLKSDKELYTVATTTEKNRDRAEKRTCFLLKDISWLDNLQDWRELKSVFAIKRETTKNGIKSEETNFYISNLVASPHRFLEIVRSHWKIESLHWMLDVIFNEDKSKLYTQNAEKTLNILRKFAIALHQKYKERENGKWTIKSKMFSTLLNDDTLCQLIAL